MLLLQSSPHLRITRRLNVHLLQLLTPLKVLQRLWSSWGVPAAH